MTLKRAAIFTAIQMKLISFNLTSDKNGNKLKLMHILKLSTHDDYVPLKWKSNSYIRAT